MYALDALRFVSVKLALVLTVSLFVTLITGTFHSYLDVSLKKPEEALEIWQEKLQYLYIERAKASDPGVKFQLDKEIKETLAMLLGLEGSG